MSTEKVLSPSFKELDIKTRISRLPQVINEYNNHTSQLFNNICAYTDSSQYVKIPVVTSGLIKGTTGDFNNININGIVKLSDNAAKSTDFLKIITSHNLCDASTRFSVSRKDALKDSSWTHDSYSIYHNDSSSLGDMVQWLYNSFDEIIGGDYLTKDELIIELAKKVDVSVFNIAIENIQENINILDSSLTTLKNDLIGHLTTIYNKLNINKDVTINNDIEDEPMPVVYRMSRNVNSNYNSSEIIDEHMETNEFVEVYNAEPNFYSYPINLYTSIPEYSEKYYKCKPDYYDVKNQIRFKYYNTNGAKYVKIDNELPVVIHGNIGEEIDLIIEKNYDKDINIKLSSNKSNYSYVSVKNNDIPLARITLVCVDYNDVYGSIWYVKNYSGNIQLK